MVGPRALIGIAVAACALTIALLSVPPADAAGRGSSVASASASLAVDVRQDVVEDTFEQAECPVEIPAEHEDRVTCGELIVPERRSAGSDPERTLRLPVIFIESLSPEAVRDPLVFPTAGGPGAGSLTSLWYFLHWADWATDDRDVILIEQRGDAYAEPSLDCPELGIENFVVDGALLSDAEERKLRSEQIEACRTRLVEEGVDLSAYSSAQSAADLADLRTAFGYDRWNLYGVSYGARLALTTMRDRPEGLRAVILDGVYPPQINRYEQTPAGFTAAVDTLLADCAADADCSTQYPDLEQDLLDVLARTAETPFSVTVKNPADRSPLAVEVSDTDLTAGLFRAFYDANLVRVLPYLIDRLARGDEQSVIPLAQQNVDFADYFTEGLNLSIDCAEEAPFNDDERIAAALEAEPILAHYALSDGFREDCELWGVPALPASENAAVTSGVPTLLTTGGYDPVTPSAFAESTAATLATRYRYDFPGMGHGAVWANWVDDCAAGIAQQFLRDPATEPDASCIADTESVDFITSEDVHPTSAIYRFDGDVIQDRDPIQIGIMAFTLLVFVSTLVYGAVYGLRWLGRRDGDAPGGTVLAAVTSSGLNLAYVGGMVLVLLNADPLILGFGLPTGIWPLLVVPFVALGATILLTVLVIRAWMQGDGTLLHRIALSVSAFASLAFAAWLLARGLLML
jgi:pimeloyl-ACP methyl ester carboxylesterase